MLLQARGQVTAGELAERLEVSPRTVYRDADALSSAGVPVYTERGRCGGIRLLPGYRTDVTGLTRDEARALFVLTTGGAHEDLGLGNAARSAVLKVMRAVPEPFRPAATATSQRILVDPAARVLLSFGGDVEVVSPPEVRADLAAVAAAVVARYGPGGPGG